MLARHAVNVLPRDGPSLSSGKLTQLGKLVLCVLAFVPRADSCVQCSSHESSMPQKRSFCKQKNEAPKPLCLPHPDSDYLTPFLKQAPWTWGPPHSERSGNASALP